jgi:uncharacterized membrane protein (DUF373 family)
MNEQSKNFDRMNKTVKTIERFIIKSLIALMSLLLVLATIQLAYLVVISILESETFLLDMDVLMDLFGVFLLVLIGIELLDTIKVYFKEHDIHVEVVMLVALIAIARKIILMDASYYSGLEVLGIAAVVIALSLGYYLIKKAGGAGFWPKDKTTVKDIVIEEKEFDPEKQATISEKKKVLKEHSNVGGMDRESERTYRGPKDIEVEKRQRRKPGKRDDNTDEAAK